MMTARLYPAATPYLPASKPVGWRGLVPLIRGAHGVLELPVGTIAATSTTVGDRIALD